MTHFKIVYKLFIHYFKMCHVALFVIYVVTNGLQSKRRLLNLFMVGKIPSQYIIFNYSQTCIKFEFEFEFVTLFSSHLHNIH